MSLTTYISIILIQLVDRKVYDHQIDAEEEPEFIYRIHQRIPPFVVYDTTPNTSWGRCH